MIATPGLRHAHTYLPFTQAELLPFTEAAYLAFHVFMYEAGCTISAVLNLPYIDFKQLAGWVRRILHWVWIPYHIESSVKYVAPSSGTIISPFVGCLSFWLRMWCIRTNDVVNRMHTHIHTYLQNEWIGMGLTTNVQWQKIIILNYSVIHYTCCYATGTYVTHGGLCMYVFLTTWWSHTSRALLGQ